jgi:membrane protein insertase Oxa1/YidC/SpoIIIJ
LNGFTAMVKYQNLTTFESLKATYESVYEEQYAKYTPDADAEEKATADAEKAVVEAYEQKKDGFIWIKNIFMPDTPWVEVIPDYATFSGTGGGGLFQVRLNITGIDKVDYEKIMNPITDSKSNSVNGLLILPLLCLALNILMTKLNPQGQQPAAPPAYGQNAEAMAKQSQSMGKVMIYIMPLMMFVFALFYSSAFTLYLVVSTSFSIVFNLIYNAFAKKKDKQEENTVESTTYVRKSELETIKKQKEKEEQEKAAEEKDAKAKKILEKTQSEFKDIDKL